MSALNPFFRRTLVSATVNPPPTLSLPPHHHHSVLSLTSIAARRRTLPRCGAGLRVPAAHVRSPTTSTKNINRMKMGKNNHKKRIYMPCSATYSSSSSSSSGFEEREIPGSSSTSSFSSGQHFLVADMGHENNNGNFNNGVWHQNGTVLKNEVPHSSKLLTLPTLLTLARVAAIPVFIGTFYVDNWLGMAATTSIFIAAAITDWLDGYLARKMDLGTAFGAFLDPVADKLMVAATLVLLCSRPPETAIFGDVPWLFPVAAIAIIGREITMSAVREWAASQNTKLLQAVAVNNLGKWKTATQMTALTILLATRDSSLGGHGAMVTSGVVLLYISSGLAVWSLIVYMRKIWKVLMK